MRNYTLILFILIAIMNCSTPLLVRNKGQNNLPKLKNYIAYYPVVTEADSLYLIGEYEKAFNKLDSLFKLYEPVNLSNEQSLYIKVAYKSRQKIDYKKHFQLFAEKFGFDTILYSYDSLLVSIFKNINIKEEEFRIWQERYRQHIYPELTEMIKTMVLNDGFYRGKDYQEEEFQYLRDSIDAINEKKLVQIFERYGYPNSTIFKGENRYNHISTILLHTGDSIRMNYFAPKLFEFVKRGECSPKVYASMIDQYYVYNGEKQIYGTNFGPPIKNDTLTTCELRLSIGLPCSLSLNKWNQYMYLKKDGYFITRLRLKKFFERHIYLKRNK